LLLLSAFAPATAVGQRALQPVFNASLLSARPAYRQWRGLGRERPKNLDVEDCAMIGVVAEVGEQDIKLFVQPKRGAAIRPAELSGWLAERLAPFQNPRYIAVVDSFERTPSQRIAKRGLPRDTTGCWDRLA
jgi:acyl-CoA synthetase (AMP-forming)/AMP-acid ligase II